MDSPNSTKSDPSLLLLNEIEILLAQTRLMELYLKQAQVTAANESARILEQHQAELALLRYALTEKEQIVAARQTTVSETEKNLFEQLQNLQNQLSDKQRRLDDRDTQLRHADSDVAVLRNRIAQLQAANDQAGAAAQDSARVRQDLQSALTALRQELEENQQDFLRQQLLSRELQESLHTQLDQLQSRLIERQVWAKAADTEIRQAKTEITQLHQRVAELQAGRQEVEATAGQELERARSRFETELAGLQAALAERDRTLRETQTAMSEIERSVRAKIQTLHSQLGQKQEQIELRDGELRAAHAQIGALQQRIAELEAANQQVAVSVGELDRLRSSFAGEISNLQHEVAVRERALSERQEAVTAVELALHGKIQALQEELARSRSAVETRENEVANARAEADALRQRMDQLETGAAANLAARQLAEDARHALEAELTKLSDALAHKEAILAEHETRFQSLENQLRGEIADLRNQLEQQKRLVEQSNAELERLRREIALLQEQKAQFEHSHRELEQNSQQAAALRQEFEARLHSKDEELRAAQAHADELKGQIEAKLAEPQIQSTERQLLAESRAAEIGDLKTEISRLSEQSAARESALEEVRASLLKETASSRAAHHAEIAALRDNHIIRQQTLEKVLGQQKEQIANLLGQIHELEQRTTDSAMQIRNREQNLAASMAESGALRARLQDLESLRQGENSAAESEVEKVRSKLEAELGSLRNDLQQKTWALAQHQASMENLALAHRNQIQKLEDKLAEQQNSVKDRSGELETAHSQTRSQQRRIEELEMELQHARLTAVRGAEQIRQQYAARTEELNSRVSRQAAALQERETAQSHLEQMLRGEIDRLVREAQEKNLILQSRNDELIRAKSDRDSVHERYKDFESAMSQNEAAATANAERMRTEFQAQLALLQAELSQKEWALEEQRAAASGMDQQYREQIEALRQQLAQTESRAQEKKTSFFSAKTN